MKISELLGFTSSDKELEEFDKKITGLTKGVRTFGSVVLSVAEKTIRFVESTAKQGDEIAKAAKAAGLSNTVYQEYAFALKENGVGQEELNSSLAFFKQLVGRAALGYEDATTAFNKLNINIHDSNGELKSQEALLQEVTDRISGTQNIAEQLVLTNIAFSDSQKNMAKAIATGNAELNRQRKLAHELGVVMSDSAIGQSQEFVRLWRGIGNVLEGLGKIIGVALLPVFNELLGDVFEWLMQNRELIAQDLAKALEPFAFILLVIGKAAFWLIKGLWSLITAMGGLETISWVLIAVLSTFMAFRLVKFIMGLKDAFQMLGGFIKGNVFIMRAWGAVVKGVSAGIGKLSLLMKTLGAGAKMIPTILFKLWGIAVQVVRLAISKLPFVLKALGIAMRALPIIGLITLIALLIDDIMGWVNGGDSWIGKLLGPWEEFYARFQEILASARLWITDFIEKVVEMVDFVLSLPGRIGSAAKELLQSIPLIGGFFGDKADPAADMSASAGVNRSNVSVTENVTVNVPPGTTQEQAMEIERQVRQQVNKELQKELRFGLQTVPAT
jgi:hypothetical protein